jgi:hypothetical protein
MWRSALVVLLSVLAAPAAFAARPKWVAGEVLVKLNDRVAESADGPLFQRFGVRDVQAVFPDLDEELFPPTAAAMAPTWPGRSRRSPATAGESQGSPGRRA